MFGSPVLEVAIGVVFAFLAVSLATGTIVEALASLLQWRATTLKRGMKELFNDPDFTGVAKELYAHASVNPRGEGGREPDATIPSYIDPQLLAAALMDVVGISEKIATRPSGAETVNAARQAVTAFKAADQSVLSAQTKTLLDGIIARTGGDIPKMRGEIAHWFDQGMAQLSGYYKRKTQAFSLGIALALAIVLNVNALALATALWEQPTVTAKIAADSSMNVEATVKQLTASLPVGWPDGRFFRRPDGRVFGCWDWLYSGFGWCATALSALFGAPFWFDLLQNLVRLRGTGPKEPQTREREHATP